MQEEIFLQPDALWWAVSHIALIIRVAAGTCMPGSPDQIQRCFAPLPPRAQGSWGTWPAPQAHAGISTAASTAGEVTGVLELLSGERGLGEAPSFALVWEPSPFLFHQFSP